MKGLTGVSLMVIVFYCTESFICSQGASLFIEYHSSCNISTFGDAPLATVIGIMILNALQKSPCWCVADQCFNMDSVGLLFINHPIVCEMFILHQNVIKIFLKRIWFLVPQKRATTNGSKLWNLASIGQNWTLLLLKSGTPSILMLSFIESWLCLKAVVWLSKQQIPFSNP